MPKTKPRKDPAELSFEEAYLELETIVQQLESGDLALENMLALFERGQALAARCQSLLETAELKVRQLNAAGDLADFKEDPA